MPSGKASECPGRVCAVLATGYQPGLGLLLTLAEEPHRPGQRAVEVVIAVDETETETKAEPKRDDWEKIEIGDRIVEPVSDDESVSTTLETLLPKFDIDSDLTEDQKKALLDVLTKHARAFATSPDDLGHMKGVMHEIDTGHNRPVNQPPRRLPPPKMLKRNGKSTTCCVAGSFGPRSRINSGESFLAIFIGSPVRLAIT